jgi:hypothetical protein
MHDATSVTVVLEPVSYNDMPFYIVTAYTGL